MTKGLFKSITLHFGILFIFLYGAEIFKQNKRFEIYEIPLEIVDVSDQTVNKTDKVKKQKKRVFQKTNFFTSQTKVETNPSRFCIERRKKKKKKLKKQKSPHKKKKRKKK